jgi:hypothetical protein
MVLAAVGLVAASGNALVRKSRPKSPSSPVVRSEATVVDVGPNTPLLSELFIMMRWVA